MIKKVFIILLSMCILFSFIGCTVDYSDKPKYFKQYTKSKDFGYIGTSAKLELDYGDYTLITTIYKNYLCWQIDKQYVKVFEKDNKLYLQAGLSNEEGVFEEASYVANIPEGMNPLEELETDDNITDFTNLVYIDTIDTYDKVSFELEDEKGYLYITTNSHKIAKIESENSEYTSIVTYFSEDNFELDIPIDAKEIKIEELQSIYSLSATALIFVQD